MTKFVLLNSADNVLICCQATQAKETIAIDDQKITILTNIEVGHKIARKNIIAGNKIIRYGVSIGSAIDNIAIGEHIHMHNMRSDYIPSHTRQTIAGE